MSMQIVQFLLSLFSVLFNLFGPFLRLFSHIVSSIPGSKSVLKFLPFLKPQEEEKKCSSKYWPSGKKIYTREDLMRDYLNDPEVKERMLLETLNPAQREIYFNNKKLRTIQYSYPENYKVQIKFRKFPS